MLLPPRRCFVFNSTHSALPYWSHSLWLSALPNDMPACVNVCWLPFISGLCGHTAGVEQGPRGKGLNIRGYEGVWVLDRETLSGSLLGTMPRFPAAGPLALRLAAARCDSIPATASQIWAGCHRVPSQSGHTQHQITPEVANGEPGRARCHPSQM